MSALVATPEQRLIRMFEGYLADKAPSSQPADWQDGYDTALRHVRKTWALFKSEKGLSAPAWGSRG